MKIKAPFLGNGGAKWREPACKPGSVKDSHSSGMCVTAHLKQPTQEQWGRHLALSETGMFLYLVLLRVGFTLPSLLPETRCALTAPFHPYQWPSHWRYIFCGTFRRLSPPRRYLAPCPPEPGLSSAPRTNRGTATVRPTPYPHCMRLSAL